MVFLGDQPIVSDYPLTIRIVRQNLEGIIVKPGITLCSCGLPDLLVQRGGVPAQGGRDQTAGKTLMTFGIIHENEIGAAWICWGIKHTAVGIDLQNEGASLLIDPYIAAPEAGSLQFHEETCRDVAQP